MIRSKWPTVVAASLAETLCLGEAPWIAPSNRTAFESPSIRRVPSLLGELRQLLGRGLGRERADDDQRGDRGKERGKDGVAIGEERGKVKKLLEAGRVPDERYYGP